MAPSPMRIMPHVVVGITRCELSLNSVMQSPTEWNHNAWSSKGSFRSASLRVCALARNPCWGGTLSYGYLIQTTLHESAEWSHPPEASGILAEWCSQAQRSFPGGFKQVWAQTLSEMLALLEKSLKGINAGAISLDSRILQELGCFDRKVNGAGTICAAAAIYLASKYAPDPQNGLAEAATLKGADTDTIASMAGVPTRHNRRDRVAPTVSKPTPRRELHHENCTAS